MKSPPQAPSDAELLVRIQEGERSAFEMLFRSYYEELCAFVESRITASETASDLVQNVFLNLWRRRRDLEVRSTLRAYLFGAARNESISYRERQNVRSRNEEEKMERRRRCHDWSPLSPVENLEQEELKEVIQKAISDLPARRREVYVLSRHHGLTYKEIASVMDISPKTVDNQMVEALKFLRERVRSRSPRAIR